VTNKTGENYESIKTKKIDMPDYLKTKFVKKTEKSNTCKNIIDYWNGKRNLQKHTKQNTLEKIEKILLKKLKTETEKQIIDSIDVYNNILDKEFITYSVFAYMGNNRLYKCGLYDFFNFNQYVLTGLYIDKEKQTWKKELIEIGSYYELCKKGFDFCITLLFRKQKGFNKTVFDVLNKECLKIDSISTNQKEITSCLSTASNKLSVLFDLIKDKLLNKNLKNFTEDYFSFVNSRCRDIGKSVIYLASDKSILSFLKNCMIY